jgi:hypothetical protein
MNNKNDNNNNITLDRRKNLKKYTENSYMMMFTYAISALIVVASPFIFGNKSLNVAEDTKRLETPYKNTKYINQSKDSNLTNNK